LERIFRLTKDESGEFDVIGLGKVPNRRERFKELRESFFKEPPIAVQLEFE
jgi:hypothetical protein